MKMVLKGNANPFVQPVMAVAFAIVSAASTECAFHYRFSEPHLATGFDVVTNSGMAGLFVLIAKINLVQMPQRQNVALFAAGGAGVAVAAAIHDFILLFSK